MGGGGGMNTEGTSGIVLLHREPIELHNNLLGKERDGSMTWHWSVISNWRWGTRKSSEGIMESHEGWKKLEMTRQAVWPVFKKVGTCRGNGWGRKNWKLVKRCCGGGVNRANIWSLARIKNSRGREWD